jgi:hypothetical protein
LLVGLQRHPFCGSAVLAGKLVRPLKSDRSFAGQHRQYFRTQAPITDRGISQEIALNLSCGKDLNHMRIQWSDGLDLTALLDHLETCEECSQCSGKRDVEPFAGGNKPSAANRDDWAG